MASKVIVKEWLFKADQDFGYASTSFQNGLSYFDQICFLFHQAGEKYLKAYIVKHDLPFRKIHNLVELMEICKSKDREFENLKDQCAILNPFYIETRYGDVGFKIHTKEDALSARGAALKIQQFVRKKLAIDHEITPKELKAAEKEVDREFRQFENKNSPSV